MSKFDLLKSNQLSAARKRLLELSRASSVRNTTILASSRFAATAIVLAFTPLATRLYGPEAFGALGVFLAITGILGPIAALSYPLAIVLPEKDAESIGLAILSLTIAFATTLLTLLIILFFGDNLIEIFGIDATSTSIYLIPLTAFFAVCLSVIEQWLNRKTLFRVKGIAEIFKALFTGCARVLVGLIYPSAFALIVISIFSIFMHALMLIIGIRWGVNSHRTLWPVKVSLLSLAKRHIDFPAYRAPEQFINAASVGLPVLILSSIFGPASAGFYALAMSALGAPLVLVGKSILDVAYPRLNAARQRNEAIFPLIRNSTLALLPISAILFIVFILFGPLLFSTVFGDEWVTSGHYASWLALWLFSALLNRPSVSAIPVLYLQKFFLFYSVFSIATRISAMFIGYVVFESAYAVVAFLSIAASFLNLLLILLTLNFSHGHDARHMAC